ncbi:hypothetical protein Noda2021_12700 [Candidatus Dependentiae bacterium Noda2021]|nr:hypothetical protein Noda2021_12700 [Candidatus Dependentiae bacterium Noda2021]
MQKVFLLTSILLGSVVSNTFPMDIDLADNTIAHFNSPSVEALRRESKVFQALEEDVSGETNLPLKSVTQKGIQRLRSFLSITKSFLKEKKSNTKLVKKQVKEKSAAHDLPTVAEDLQLFDYLGMERYSLPSLKVAGQKLAQEDAWRLYLDNPAQFDDLIDTPTNDELKKEFYQNIQLPRLYSSVEVDKKIIKTKKHPYLKKIALTEDAQTIFAIDQNNLLAWNAQSGKKISKIAFGDTITDMAVCRGSNEVILGTANGQVLLCNAIAKNTIQRAAHNEPVSFVTSAPNNVYFATAAHNGEVKIWSRSGDCLHTLSNHQAPVTALTFSADGMLLATGSEDCAVHVFNIATGKTEKRITDYTEPITKLQFSAHGNLLLTASDRQGKIMVTPVHEEGANVALQSSERLALTLGSNDLRTLVIDDTKSCNLLKIDSNQQEKQLKITQPDTAAFTDDENNVLFGSRVDDLMHIIDTSNGKRLKTFEGGQVVHIRNNKALVKHINGDIGLYSLQPLLHAQELVKALDLKQQFVVGHLNNAERPTTLPKKSVIYPIFKELPKPVQKLLVHNKKVLLKK